MYTILNGKRDGFIGEDRLYLGRFNKPYNLVASPLANPYSIGKDGSRQEVIAKYRVWLWKIVKKYLQDGKSNPVIETLIYIAKHPNLKLVCWCFPEPCHVEVVISCVNWLVKEGKI